MSDGPALLAAILAQPEEDTPRLAYADHLDEQGEHARAEFIRYMIRKGGVLYVDNLPARIAARRTPMSRWTTVPGKACIFGAVHVVNKILPAPDPLSRCDVHFRRGLATEVHCPSQWWLIHADVILAAHPVANVRLTSVPEYEWQFVNLPPDWPVSVTDHNRRLVAFDALEHRWPGIAFELPPAVRPIGMPPLQDSRIEGSGFIPSPEHVRSGVSYGPSSGAFTGTLRPPG